MRGARGAGAGVAGALRRVDAVLRDRHGDGFREPGFSKERRLEPQITIGLLTDAAGFPLTVEAFEGNKAETATMLPVINAFMAAHQLSDVTVVADAGMISEANQIAIEAAGLSFILGARIPDVPDVVARMAQEPTRARRSPTGRCSPSRGRPARTTARRGPGHLLPVPGRPGPAHAARHRRAGRQGREGRRRARRRSNATGSSQLTGGDQERQPRLEAKARALAGMKGYITNLDQPDRRSS